MLKPLRYIAVDFETTGLDLSKEEPIQIGIVEFNKDFQVVNTFSSLIKPQKPISELKSVVSWLTQIDIEQIQQAPSCEELLPQISGFFGGECVIIGHTVSFDIRVLERFFGIRVQHSVDTFVLGQTLFHYQPSHSLESLYHVFQDDSLAQLSGVAFEKTRKTDGHSHHDALFDSFAAAQLFAYFVRKVEILSARFTSLPFLLSRSEGVYHLIFDLPVISRPVKLELPLLQQPLPSQTAPASSGVEIVPLPKHENKLFVGHLGLEQVLKTLAAHQPCVFAFSHPSKLNRAKTLLQKLGYQGMGFAKQEQILDPARFALLMNQDRLKEFEMHFIIKYCHHSLQGLGILDIVSSNEYLVFSALKETRKSSLGKLTLVTHQGLYHLAKEKKSQLHELKPNIFFMDSPWWRKSYNLWLNQPYDVYYFLQYVEQLEYKYHLLKSDFVASLATFVQSFSIWVGVFGGESTQAWPKGGQNKTQIDALLSDPRRYKTLKFWERCEQHYQDLLGCDLEDSDREGLVQYRDTLVLLLHNPVTLHQHATNYQYITYTLSTAVEFTSFPEFLHQFDDLKTFFCSHTQPEITWLNASDQQIFQPQSFVQIFDLDHVQKALLDYFKHHQGSLVILTDNAFKNKQLFEFAHRMLDKQVELFVEKSTGSLGKRHHKLSSVGPQLYVGSYQYLLDAISKSGKKPDQILVFAPSSSLLGPMIGDLGWYGEHKNEGGG